MYMLSILNLLTQLYRAYLTNECFNFLLRQKFVVESKADLNKTNVVDGMQEHVSILSTTKILPISVTKSK